jgi:peptidoglycan/xylan/chitin deacetylase (PgdA/CDA1 family)
MNALVAVLVAFPVVLMYHRVDVYSPSDSISQRLTISPAQFAAELREIQQKGLRTIGIAELVNNMAAHRSPQHAVVITFDDGYSDQFRYAFPLLQRFGARATFFVNVGTIGTPGHLSWGEVEAMSRAGMSIDCHGVTHLDLALLSSVQQEYQIDGCVRSLNAHLQTRVLAYAYPSGRFNAKTIELERRAGLLVGFTTDPRFQKNSTSPYQLTRTRIVSGLSDARFGKFLSAAPVFVDVDPSPQEVQAPPRRAKREVPRSQQS